MMNYKKDWVFVVDDPKAHTSKPVDVKKLIVRTIDEKTLEIKEQFLGDILFDHQKQINALKEDRQRYKNNMQKLLAIIEVLVNQTELNNMNINDLKAIKEEIENE